MSIFGNKCHICGKGREKYEYEWTTGGQETTIPVRTEIRVDYHELKQCTRCRRWACYRHWKNIYDLCTSCDGERQRGEREREREEWERKPEWQRRIEIEARRQADSERIRKEEEEKRKKAEREAADKAALQAHQAKYRCLVCGRPSEGPTLYSSGSVWSVREDWNNPRGLTRCKICSQWVCFSNSCYYMGVCKNCGGRL